MSLLRAILGRGNKIEIVNGLKACPFCGRFAARLIMYVKQSDKRIVHRIECPHTDCRIQGPIAWNEKDAREKWNRRT